MVSWRSQEIFSYQTRMRTEAVWDTLTFLLNGFLFILIGLQLPFILKQLTEYSFSTLIGYGLLVSLATILARMLWVFSGAYGVKLFAGKKKDGEGDLSGKRGRQCMEECIDRFLDRYKRHYFHGNSAGPAPDITGWKGFSSKASYLIRLFCSDHCNTGGTRVIPSTFDPYPGREISRERR